MKIRTAKCARCKQEVLVTEDPGTDLWKMAPHEDEYDFDCKGPRFYYLNQTTVRVLK
jgi:hypothetical protein